MLLLRQQRPILLAMLLLAAMAVARIQAVPRVIVAFKPDAVTAAAAVSAASADAQVAAAAAGAAAQARGASAAKQAAVAKLAAEAAAAQAAVASLSRELQGAAASAGLPLQQEAAYSTVLQGAAYSAPDAAAAAELLRELELTKSTVDKVWLVGHVQLPTPVAAASQAAAAAAAGPQQADGTGATAGNAATTGLASLAAAGSSLDGTGQLICLIDTGITYSLELFGSCSGINEPAGQCRVVAGADLVGDDYNGSQSGPPRAPDSNPLECLNHGTQVASVAATSNGVAHGALLGSYKVFGCRGSTTDDVVIAAIDRAVRDGCDIINLSISSGSGYAEGSVYGPVMQAATSRGVLVVKAAGNQGRDGGPFVSDVSTAAGAITVGAVGAGERQTPLDALLTMSSFSSLGPAATLELSPHVAAPGSWINAVDGKGAAVLMQGTSFSSPYVAGVLALWLQHKQQVAAASGQPLDPASVNQDAAMRALMATAAPVPDKLRADFSASVAAMGAGVIQADALLMNQLSIDPPALSLPSGLTGTFTTSITLRWNGPANPSKTMVTYSLRHRPSVAMTLTDGWWGTKALAFDYRAPRLAFRPARFTINTATPGASQTVQVTFTFPARLTSRAQLYSGVIIATPAQSGSGGGTGNATLASLGGAWPVSVPFLGYSKDFSRIRLLARPLGDDPFPGSDADTLSRRQATLCYAPGSQPKYVGSIIDTEVPVDSVCAAVAADNSQVLNVSLGVLSASPECSLRIVVVNEVPAQRLYLSLIDDATGQLVSTLRPLELGSGNSKADARKVWSTCTRFDGSYTAVAASGVRFRTWLKPGSVYRLNATYTGPLAAGDAAVAGRTARNTTVAIRGRFLVAR